MATRAARAAAPRGGHRRGPHAGTRDRPPRVVPVRQHRWGRLQLYSPRLRLHRDGSGLRDWPSRPRLPRARAGTDPPGGHGHAPGDDEIGEHHKRHGDGVHKVALSVPDAEAAWQAVEYGARGVMTPHWGEGRARPRRPLLGRLRRHRPPLRPARRLRRSLPADSPRETRRPPARLSWRASTPWWATWSSATLEEWVRPTTQSGVRHDRAHPLLGRRGSPPSTRP